MDIKIRAARVEDAFAICQIYAYYVKNTAVSFEYTPPNEAEMARRIQNTLKAYPYLVAEINGRVVGYAYAGAFKSRPAYQYSVETSIYVARDCKKCGIGKALYAELENKLKAQGILNSYACITVPGEKGEDEYSSWDSVRFHEKTGYTHVGTFRLCGYKFNRWYSMVFMEKMLGEHTKKEET